MKESSHETVRKSDCVRCQKKWGEKSSFVLLFNTKPFITVILSVELSALVIIHVHSFVCVCVWPHIRSASQLQCYFFNPSCSADQHKQPAVTRPDYTHSHDEGSPSETTNFLTG